MNVEIQSVRAMLRSISPVKAKKLLDGCELPEDEFILLLDQDIRHKYLEALSDFLGMSYATAKGKNKTDNRKHKTALKKIYDTIMNL